ncbi:MAG: SoxR reducing system RseC family protein [Gallionellaceae bacterium]|jgi:sigma-E factor negative regulatory protein RseC
MLETRAIVVKIHGNEAFVESKGGAGCGNCDSEKGCGSSKLTQLFCSKPRQFKVLNEVNAKVGDEVQITLPQGVLLRSAILMYGIPLSMLLSGGMLGAHWAADPASRDGYAAIGSLVGLVGGFILAKWMAKRQHVMAVASSLP